MISRLTIGAAVVAIAVTLGSCRIPAPAHDPQEYQERPSYALDDFYDHFPQLYGFSCAFPADARDDVRAGFQYWNRVAGREIFTEDEECPPTYLGIVIYQSAAPFLGDKDVYAIGPPRVRLPNGILQRSGTIVFYPAWSANPNHVARVNTARHEVGHLLGFDHREDPSCLMYRFVDPNAKTVTDLCARELQDFHAAYDGVK